jgi:hypothetical protein
MLQAEAATAILFANIREFISTEYSEEEADRLLKLEENPDQRKLEDSPELWRSR